MILTTYRVSYTIGGTSYTAAVVAAFAVELERLLTEAHGEPVSIQYWAAANEANVQHVVMRCLAEAVVI